MKNSKSIFDNLVYQRKLSEDNGDCARCCVATLLNKTYEEVPDFNTASWLEDLSDYLWNNGSDLETVLKNKTFYDNLCSVKLGCFDKNDKLKVTKALSKRKLSKLDGYVVKNRKLFLGLVLSANFYDDLSAPSDQIKHMVICDSDCQIVFDPSVNGKDIVKYPFANIIGYSGLVSVLEVVKEKL